MPNELAIYQGGAIQAPPYDGDRLPAIHQLGAMLAKSGYFSDAREAAQAAVKVMAGEELGLAPIASMMGINVIKGKVALSANLMAAQVRRHGYNYRVKAMDSKGCVIEFLGKDGKTVLGESAFNEDDAKAAEIKSDMYKKYPRNMYFSRAMSNGVRWFCPEITSGMPVYTPEEMGAKVDSEGEVIHEEADPRGSQEAANAVAERKITEMKAARETAPAKAAPKSTDYTMLKAFKEIKAKIGSDAYYKVLGANGYTKSDEITDASKGRSVYKEMQDVLRGQQKQASEPIAAPQPAAQLAEQEGAGFKADASDLPDEWAEGRD